MNLIATRTLIEATYTLDHDHITEHALIDLLETDPMYRERQMYYEEHIDDDTCTYGQLAWRVVFYIDATSMNAAHQRWSEIKVEMDERLAERRVDILALDVYTI